MHGSTRKKTRSVIAMLASMMLLTGMVAMVAAPASAGPGSGPGNGMVGVAVANPGEVVFELTGGLISVNNGTQEFDLGGNGDDFDTDPDADPVTLTGTINELGNVHIPAANVLFPTVQLEEGGFNLTIDISAGADVHGDLNVWSGEFSADLPLEIRIDTGVAAVCTLQLPMQLSTANEGGVAYARNGQKAGSATLADDAFAIPATIRSGLLAGLVCPQLESAFGIPSPSGTNSATLELVADPVLKFKAVGLGEHNITSAVCEQELGGSWSSGPGGVKSCTTENVVITVEESGLLQLGTSGTSRWRTNVEKTTTTVIEETVSQQGTVNAPGTEDSQTTDEEEISSVVEFQMLLCQQGGILSGTWNNRAFSSPNCVSLMNDWIATQ